jgi:putative N6-adenine-specific DNA methylase
MYKLAAQTFYGLEHLLADELKSLGASDVVVGRRVVTFKGDLAMVYKSNIWLRTALNVLVNLTHGPIRDKQSLYDMAYEVPWEDFFGPNHTIAVGGAVKSMQFRDSRLPFLIVKDAIADRMRNQTGRRPNVSKESPDVRIHVRVGERDATLSIDSSGDALFKRGYRQLTGISPINEVLAAGLVMLTGWKGDCHLVDPMCGSGTLLVEAALMVRGIPPGFKRRNYAFKRWRNFEGDLLDEIRKYEERPIKAGVRLIGSDESAIMTRKTRRNLDELPEGMKISLQVGDVADFEPPEEPGVLITNPPYGERMNPNDIDLIYKAMGNMFKQRMKGWDCWVISPNMAAMKHIGLAPAEKYTLYNGPLECSFRNYPVR